MSRTTSKTCLRPRILRLGILSWTYLGHKINVQDEIFNNVQDGKVSYKSIGSFKTRREAEYALEVYQENPIDYSQKIKTFEDLYNAWSYYYFEHVSVTAVRSVRSAYSYCSKGYSMDIKKMGPGHIKDYKHE